jgi:LysM repeat protein
MKPVARLAGVALVAALMAGCSTDALRFQDGFYTGADGVTTGSVPTPRADVANGQMAAGQMAGGSVAAVPPGGYPQAGAQSYPAAGGNRYALAPVSAGPSSSASVERSTLAPAGQAMPQAAAQPMPTVAAQDPLTTATTPAAPAAGRPAGWSTDGAPRVSLQPGETISSLSRRYGVPASEIMRANGITDATRVTPGQQLVIPGYSRGGAPAPAQVAAAPAAAGDPALAQRSLNEQAQLLTQAPTTAVAGQGGSYTVKSVTRSPRFRGKPACRSPCCVRRMAFRAIRSASVRR